MLIYIIYGLIIITANTIGAISGMGGGVLIKPILDIVNYHSVAEIAFYSSLAVFTMSISSTIKQLKNGLEIKWINALSLSFGALLGGYLGQVLLELSLQFFSSDNQVKKIQNIILIFSLLLILLISRVNIHLNKKSHFLYFFSGLFLGIISIFLAIGGGPINVILLYSLFPLSLTQATSYSIISIFFSQFSKLISLTVSGELLSFDFSFIYVIIPAAIFGGILGASLSKKISEKYLMIFFNLVVLAVILINLFSLSQ